MDREYWVKEARKYERKAREAGNKEQVIYFFRAAEQCWLNAGDSDQDEIRQARNEKNESQNA